MGVVSRAMTDQVGYELRQLCAMPEEFEKTDPANLPRRAAFVESQLLHVRNLYELIVLGGGKGLKRKRFTGKGWQPQSPACSRLDSLIDDINDRLTHIGATRESGNREWPLRELARDSIELFDEFVSAAAENKFAHVDVLRSVLYRSRQRFEDWAAAHPRIRGTTTTSGAFDDSHRRADVSARNEGPKVVDASVERTS
jgi:hypothetical protein